MTEIINPETVAGLAAAGVGLPTVFIFLRKLLLISSNTNSAIINSEATSAVVRLLHEELVRLNTSNSELTIQLHKFMNENNELKSEIVKLQMTVAQMNKMIEEIRRNNA